MNTSSFNLSDYLSVEFSQALFDRCILQLSGVTELCFLLCGLFSLGYFAHILMNTWAKGEPLDFNKLMRPFVIGIITLNFSWVYNVVDGIFQPINQYTETLATSEDPELTARKKDLEKAKSAYFEEERRQNESDGFFKNLFFINSATSFFDNLYVNCIDLLLNGLEYIAGIAFGAVKLTIRAIHLSFRIILIVFGPFAFSLSVLPIFKNNWKSWLSKYINICFFIPIANLMDVIINQLHSVLLAHHITVYENAFHSLMESGSPADASLTTVMISYVIFLIAFIILYLMIPSISSYIVSAAGMESITGGITLAGSAAASKLISGTANNPLTPNILRLFNRQSWRKGEGVILGANSSVEVGSNCKVD